MQAWHCPYAGVVLSYFQWIRRILEKYESIRALYMSAGLAAILDLKTAWKRVKSDFENRVFIRNPYSIDLVEFDLDRWLSKRLSDLSENKYQPSSMFICDVPKPDGLIRPGAHLSFADRLIYAACVGACLPAIHNALKWSQGIVDFSYQLAPSPTNVHWVKGSFTGWQDFRTRSIESIEKGASYVIVADISAFYENIHIQTLISDLRGTGAPESATTQINTCLHKWAQVGKGIPQGQTPSDILAKLYLNTIDQNLRNMGFRHLRYVDDIRIFCKTRAEATKALLILARLLRNRGLNLQSAKSEILRSDAARARFEDVAAVVKTVRIRFIEHEFDRSRRGAGAGPK